MSVSGLSHDDQSSVTSPLIWPLTFTINAECPFSLARAATVSLPHADVCTPIFMPVGTQGTMKGITTSQLERLKCNMILANTYHLGIRMGEELLNDMGGLHRFMSWNHGLLTDSGGFQMVSLLSLSNVTEEGVRFRAPHDGQDLLLTPEKSMELQTAIGADICMQLDDVVHSLTTGERLKEAMERSVRWLDRCIDVHADLQQRREDNGEPKEGKQNLFAIVQGGLDPDLRRACIESMVSRDLPGYAIGGLSGGEAKDSFWRIVHLCSTLLPRDKPRYLMGVGYAEDLVVCSALGIDMFDCVFPTRTARFGTALVRHGALVLSKNIFADDFNVIDERCFCSTCTGGYTRAYLHNIVIKEPSSCHLLSVHNIAFQLQLMNDLRESVIQGRFPDFVRDFFAELHPKGDYNQWAVDALNAVNIKLN